MAKREMHPMFTFSPEPLSWLVAVHRFFCTWLMPCKIGLSAWWGCCVRNNEKGGYKAYTSHESMNGLGMVPVEHLIALSRRHLILTLPTGIGTTGLEKPCRNIQRETVRFSISLTSGPSPRKILQHSQVRCDLGIHGSRICGVCWLWVETHPPTLFCRHAFLPHWVGVHTPVTVP